MRTQVAPDGQWTPVAGMSGRIRLEEDWYTPAGNVRSLPLYRVTVQNTHLGLERVLKGRDASELQQRAAAQLEKWALREAREKEADSAEAQTAEAAAALASVRGILAATLDVDDRLDWEGMKDTREYPPHRERLRRPPEPPEIAEKRRRANGLVARCLPWKRRRLLEEAENAERRHEEGLARWARECDAARARYEAARADFERERAAHDAALLAFRERFEAGEPDALREYVEAVFEESEYPDSFPVQHEATVDPETATVVVDLGIPPQAAVPRAKEYRYLKTKREVRIVELKAREHDELYDDAVRQSCLRTLHEVFEADYPKHVEQVVVNAWVDAVDPATGHEKRACIASIAASREAVEELNLEQVDAKACFRRLKGIAAPSLAELAPVPPIMDLSREDGRVVEGRAVTPFLDEGANLAEMPWEDFEHLVREVFEALFAGHGAEVRVTRASSDAGVDAIVFDPDPIRGGKFVIQAKRYTKVVPFTAVRDLYGTMIAEGAVKGILVTTAHFGRDTREFAREKPITLISGSALVHLMSQHGHAVRIDVKEARRKLAEE